QIFARSTIIGLGREVGGLHHERVAFPTSVWIAEVLLHPRRQRHLPALAHGNDAVGSRVARRLVEDRNRSRRLDDAMVDAAAERWERQAETPLGPRSILGSLRGAIQSDETVARRCFVPSRRNRSRFALRRPLQERLLKCLERGLALLRLRGHWRNPPVR